MAHKATSIKLYGSESNLFKAEKIFHNWTNANSFVWQIVEEAKQRGGYLKTKFDVTFEDGSVYTGDMDVSEREDTNINEHIMNYLRFMAGNIPDHMTEDEYIGYMNFVDEYGKFKAEALNWLINYDFYN